MEGASGRHPSTPPGAAVRGAARHGTMFSTQNSQNDADDDLYSGYNQSPVHGGNPEDDMYATGAAADYGGAANNFQGPGAMAGRPLYSAAGYANGNSMMMDAPTTAAPGTAFTGDAGGRPMTSMNAAGFTGAPPSRKSANFDPLKMGSNSVRCGPGPVPPIGAAAPGAARAPRRLRRLTARRRARPVAATRPRTAASRASRT